MADRAQIARKRQNAASDHELPLSRSEPQHLVSQIWQNGGGATAEGTWASAARSPGELGLGALAAAARSTIHLDRKPGHSPTAEAEGKLQDALQKRGANRSPDSRVLAAVESQLGPLGPVRVHTGSRAAETAAAFGARALTVGRDIFFGAGEYAPQTERGAELLAHELTHVAHGDSQPLGGQTHSASRPAQTSSATLNIAPAHAATERHADAVAQSAVTAMSGGLPSALDFNPGMSPNATQTGTSTIHLQRVETNRGQAAIDSTRTGEGTRHQDDATAMEDRRRFVSEYRDWLQARVIEVRGEIEEGRLQGNLLNDRVEGLLSLSEQMAAHVNNREDLPGIRTLNLRPTRGEPVDIGGAVPPDWVEPLRRLIEMVEQNGPVEGENAPTENPIPEGSRFNATDWNTRLGVPQYRTQSDNLTAPETTCNVTSFAMASERLGQGRTDVVRAIDNRLGVAEDANDEDANALWTPRVRRFLGAEMERGQNYQRLRGQASFTRQSLDAMSEVFRSQAQLEDLYAFLASLMGIQRTALVSQSADDMFDEVTGTDPENRFTSEMIWAAGNWEQLSQRVSETLEGGGAVFFSFHHKGRGREGTHIVTVQRVTDEGFVLDDPYGSVRDGYRRNQTGDAYAPAGQTQRTATYRNQVDRTNNDDWQVAQSQSLTDAESLGDSHLMGREAVLSAFYYIRLVRRPERQEPQQNAQGPARAPAR